MHLAKTHLFDKRARGAKIVIRLAGKTDHDVGRDINIGKEIPDFIDFCHIIGGRVFAVHLFQNLIGPALQGDMKMSAKTVAMPGDDREIIVRYLRDLDR